MTEELLKQADDEIKQLQENLELDDCMDSKYWLKLIKALADEIRGKEKKLKDALGWKKHYEKDNARQNLYLESYGRRLNAIREAYFSEANPPGMEEWAKKYDQPPKED